MKPRIFISSTFYDLKYIREDLSNFIKAHDFEPILFENGDIGYTPNRPLDESCYDEMKNADLVILIIGGQYGSPATGEDDNFKKYISVTRNEFRSAFKNQVPIFCFIDNAVNIEYEIYKINKSALEKDTHAINFRVVKNLNVFKFIEEIHGIGNIPITGFEKSEDIKEFMGKQWADMFKRYLIGLKEGESSYLLATAIGDMDTLLKQMKIMVDKIGEDTIKEKDDYATIVGEQHKIELNKVVDYIKENFSFEFVDDKSLKNKEKNVDNLLDFLDECIKKGTPNSAIFLKFFQEAINATVNEVTNDLLVYYLSKKGKRKELKKSLLEEKNYFSIFTDNIHNLEPDWDNDDEIQLIG